MSQFSQHLPEPPPLPQPTPRSRWRSPWRWLKVAAGLLLGLAILLGVIAACVVLSIPFIHGPGVHGVVALQRQTGDIDISKATLVSISMVSPAEGWAVGSTTGTSQAQGVILHFQNGAWKQYHGFYTYPPLTAIVMTSATSGWAVGEDGSIFRYNYNGDWYYGTSGTNTPFTSLSMVSSDEGWAAGNAFYHYQDNRWMPAPQATPLPNVSSLAMVSASEGWAIGAGGAILHYTTGAWQIAVADSGVNALSLTMDSASDGWAVGGSGLRGNALHFHNGQWQPVHIGDSTTVLYTVAMLSPAEGWAAGRSGAAGAFFHYLNGQWTRVTSPAPVVPHTLAMVSPSDGWAMGEKGLMLRYADNQWC